MTTEPSALTARASTGILGLDLSSPAACRPIACISSKGIRAAERRRSGCSSCSKAFSGRKGSLRHVVGKPTELIAVAASHGWDLSGWRSTSCRRPTRTALRPDDQYTFFHPSEVELGETTKAVMEEVERVEPARVVLDSLSEMRLLAREPLRYRRQILGLKQFFVGQELHGDAARRSHVERRRSAAAEPRARRDLPRAAGARIRRRAPPAARRQTARHPFPAADFTTSDRDRRLAGLSAARGRRVAQRGDTQAASSGSRTRPAHGGGLDRGTSTLFIGPAGAGKSALATQIAVTAAAAANV